MTTTPLKNCRYDTVRLDDDSIVWCECPAGDCAKQGRTATDARKHHKPEPVSRPDPKGDLFPEPGT